MHTAEAHPSVLLLSTHLVSQQDAQCGPLPLSNLAVSTRCLFSQTQPLSKMVSSDITHIPCLKKLRFSLLIVKIQQINSGVGIS